MSNLKPFTENGFEYHYKMLKLLNAQTAYIEIHIDEAYWPALLTYGQNIAIHAFLKGLRDP